MQGTLGSSEWFGVICSWGACLEETDWKWSQKQAGARLGRTVNVSPRVWTWYYKPVIPTSGCADSWVLSTTNLIQSGVGSKTLYLHQGLQVMHSHVWDTLQWGLLEGLSVKAVITIVGLWAGLRLEWGEWVTYEAKFKEAFTLSPCRILRVVSP